MITIATPEQARVAGRLVTRAFRPLRAVYTPTGTPPTKPEDPTCLILSVNNEIVATLSYYLERPYLRLYRIAVDPHQRHQGYAAELIDYVDHTVAQPCGFALALYTIEETGNTRVFREARLQDRRQRQSRLRNITFWRLCS